MTNIERGDARERNAARIIRNGGLVEAGGARGIFRAALTRNGQIVWEDEFNNLVFTAGKNELLDKGFAGASYTAAWYMFLVDGASAPTFNAADTAASHAGWSENTGYSNATRPAISWAAADAGAKSSTGTAFNINASGTIAGAGVATNSTKGGTTGIFYSGGAFTGGNRSVLSGDTLTVTWTGSL